MKCPWKFDILLLVTFTTISADSIELKTGERVEGVFKQAGPAGAVIEVGGQPITFTMDKVRAIYLGAAQPTTPAPSAYSEALDALKALQSVTTSGVNYRDYAARVLDARVKVDKYLASSDSDGTKTAIRVAMRYYELASTAWGARISNDPVLPSRVGIALREEPLLLECPAVKTLIAESDASAARVANQNDKMKLTPQNRAAVNAQMKDFNLYSAGNDLGRQPGLIWPCAASRIAEAEKH